MKPGVRCLVGDVRAQLRKLPEGSVHCCVTSPPYWGLRSYLAADDPAKVLELGAEATPEAYVANMVEVFREVRRVLRDDGTLWLNLGDCYARNGGRPEDDARGSAGSSDGGTPVGLKEKDLVGIPWRVAFALQADGWYLRAAIPWVKRNCLGATVRVYVRTKRGDGPMMVKDLAKLDPATVQLWNGTRWTQLQAIWPTEHTDALEIELRSGEKIQSSRAHLWPSGRGLLEAGELREGDILQRTRLAEPVEPRTPSGLPDALIGWFVGLYIAEGSLGDHDRCIQIASHKKEQARVQRLHELAAAYDGVIYTFDKGGQSMTINLASPVLLGVLERYVFGRTAKTKHLTTAAWQRTDNFLRAVLRGYLDGDGHWEPENRRWRIGFTANDDWANTLRTLCARLGVGLRLRRAKHQLNGKVYPGWRGEIRFPEDQQGAPVHYTTAFHAKSDEEIIAIRAAKGQTFYDLAVTDDPHTFALASGVLTHNCLPSSVRDRPTTAHETVFLLSKRASYFYDVEAVKVGAVGQASGNKQRRTRKDEGHMRVTGGTSDLGSSIPWNGASFRQRRDSDWFFDSLRTILDGGEGLLHDEEGNPIAVVVNPRPYKGSHYAVFPEQLVTPMIQAGTSERGCCRACGAPHMRVLERGTPLQGSERNVGGRTDGYARPKGGEKEWNNHVSPRLLGWTPSCDCPDADPVPCVTLDPFGGSGTVAAASLRLGRRSIWIDLDARNRDLLQVRLSEIP